MAELYWILLILLGIPTGLVAFRAGINLATCAGWVLLVMFHGLVIKPIFIYLGLPSKELLELTVLQKISSDEYWFGSVIVLLPYVIFLLGMFLVGYYRTKPILFKSKNFQKVAFSEKALCILGLIALAGVVVFFIQFPQMLETANKNSLATEDLSEYSGGGIWRTLAEMSYLASICALVNLGLQRRIQFNRTIFIGLSVLWLLFCLLSDQRGALVFSLVTYLVAYSRWVKPVTRQMMVILALTVVTFVVGKTAMRLQFQDVNDGIDAAAIATNFIGQNLIENGKTISIVKAVPQLLDYQYGKTYIDSILILVPRALFPEKTTVNLDTLVGNSVFDCGVYGACGVPPGLIAETYLNFGIVLLPIVIFLSGVLVGMIDNQFRIARVGSIPELFFVYSLLFFGMSVLGSGLSSVVTQLIVQLVLLSFIVLVAGQRLRPNLKRNLKAEV